MRLRVYPSAYSILPAYTALPITRLKPNSTHSPVPLNFAWRRADRDGFRRRFEAVTLTVRVDLRFVVRIGLDFGADSTLQIPQQRTPRRGLIWVSPNSHADPTSSKAGGNGKISSRHLAAA